MDDIKEAKDQGLDKNSKEYILMHGTEKEDRPSWDEYFMSICHLVATRGTCLRRQVGSVVVKDKQILATGYNGQPTGHTHCAKLGCLRTQHNIPSGQRHEISRALHAEQNAIVQAAKHGISLNGATMYITIQPCSICAKMIVNVGIKKIIIGGTYPDEFAMGFLDEAGIKVEVYKK